MTEPWLWKWHPTAWQRARGWAIAIGLALASQSPSESEFVELGKRTLLAAVADPPEAII